MVRYNSAKAQLFNSNCRRMLKTYLKEEPIYLKKRREKVISHIYNNWSLNQTQNLSRNELQTTISSNFNLPSTIIFKKWPRVKQQNLEEIKKVIIGKVAQFKFSIYSCRFVKYHKKLYWMFINFYFKFIIWEFAKRIFWIWGKVMKIKN